MNSKTLLIILGLTLSCTFTFAQKKEFKFGKIAPEEFQVKAPGIDSGAAAIKIFDVGTCSFEIVNNRYVYIYTRHFRYRILTKAGYEYANYRIPLYKSEGSAKEELYSMDAATYNMVDGKW